MVLVRPTSLAVLLAALVASVFGGCSTPAAPPDQQYIDQEKGFEITYPGNWKRWTGGIGQDLEIMPSDQTNPNVFRDNLLVHVETLTEGMTLDGFFASKVAAAEGADPEVEYQEIERLPVVLGGEDARRLVYSMSRDEAQVTSVVFFLVRGNRGYTILCSAASERFDKRRPEFEKIVGTFKLEQAGPDRP